MEYKRLTDKRLALPKNTFRQSKSKEEYLELSRVAYNTDNTEIYNRLAELEDKIEQGTLIDTEERFIIEDELWGSKNRFLICKHHIETLIEDFYPTREEAEKRLKELQNG